MCTIVKFFYLGSECSICLILFSDLETYIILSRKGIEVRGTKVGKKKMQRKPGERKK